MATILKHVPRKARAQHPEAVAVLVADCPWKFNDNLPSKTGTTRGAARVYGAARNGKRGNVLSLADLKAFPIPPLRDDAHLFLWRVSALQSEALEVAKAWGFTVKAELVWLKITAGGGRAHAGFGMGRQVRMEHEVCLIATRGRPEVHDRSIRSTFEAPLGEHSAKPDAFFHIVERLTGHARFGTVANGPRAELFAREPREGWRCFGNQLAPIASANSKRK